MAIPNSRVIHAPSKETMEMLQRRMPATSRDVLKTIHLDAVGLIQTNIVNVLYFGDIAQKAAAVFPVELTGSCPQHIVTLALLGDVSAVEAAMRAIDNILKTSENK
jgi:ethanolamine utilization microcompartment shell protein EutS